MAQTKNPFSDAMKQFFDVQYPTADLDSAAKAGKKNFETAATSAQIVSDSAQKIAARQAEIFQKNAEGALGLFKEVIASKDPKESASKQAEFAKASFENGLSQARELSEIFFKANSEAYELIGKQVTENINDATKNVAEATKKAANAAS